MTPLFSIITVTFNAESTLPPTLLSLHEQTFSDFEHIVVDGCSKDSTIEIAKEQSLPQSHIISEPDKGIYDAMNKGLRRASGKYVIFLNAGDAFHSPETLEHIARSVRDNDYPDIVYGQTQLVDEKRRFIAPRHLVAPEKLTFNSFSKGMLVCHQAFIAKKEITTEYDLSYRFSADYDWCIRCLQKSGSNIYIPQTLIDYLSEGTTTANHRASLRERYAIMCKYYGHIRTFLNHIRFIPRFVINKLKMK